MSHKNIPELTELEKALGATYPGQIEDDAVIAKIVISLMVIGIISLLVFSFFYTPDHPKKKHGGAKQTSTVVNPTQ